jgi:hypothetical protein
MKDRIIKKVAATIWDEATQSMQTFEFFMTIDMSKIPTKMFHGARKRGKSTSAGGAITINPVGMEKHT